MTRIQISRTTSRFAAGLGIAAAFVAAAGAPAGASVHGHLLTTIDGRGVATTATVGEDTSSAGYVGFPSTSSFSFTATVALPQVTCDQSVFNPTFIDAVVNGSLRTGGTGDSGIQITVQCSGSTPTYTAAGIADGTTLSTASVSAGDEVEIDGTVGATHESYTVKDVTRHTSATFHGQGLIEDVDLQLTTQFGVGTQGGFPIFTQFPYHNITVGGQPFSSIPNEGNSQVDNEDTVLVQASALSTAGKGFLLTYETNVGDSPT